MVDFVLVAKQSYVAAVSRVFHAVSTFIETGAVTDDFLPATGVCGNLSAITSALGRTVMVQEHGPNWDQDPDLYDIFYTIEGICLNMVGDVNDEWFKKNRTESASSLFPIAGSVEFDIISLNNYLKDSGRPFTGLTSFWADPDNLRRRLSLLDAHVEHMAIVKKELV